MSIEGSNEITVDAAPDRIWRVLEDSTCLSQWATMVKQTTGVRETVGSLRTCQVEWDGRKDEVVERCTEATPARRISWVMERGMMLKVFSKVAFGFDLEPKDARTTLVRMHYSYEPKNFFAGLMFRLMMSGKLDRMRQTLLSNLKAFVEKRESTAGARIVTRPTEQPG